MNTSDEMELNGYYDKNRSGSINRHEFIIGIRPYLLEHDEYRKKNAYLTSKVSRSLEEVTKIV